VSLPLSSHKLSEDIQFGFAWKNHLSVILNEWTTLQMPISLEKIIEPTSLRGIGGIRRGVAPHKLIAAGHRAGLIAQALGGTAFSVGRVRPHNAFCVQAEDAYYLYVHHAYNGYRALFRRFFHTIPSGCDVDHVLSRTLAARIGVPFILLAAVPKSANRSHASAERLGLAPSQRIFLGKTFLLDERMFHKVMGRRVGMRQSAAVVRAGYVLGSKHDLGLTLKQRGIWNTAFCIDVVHFGFSGHLKLRAL
jgi:hypothetical protein